VGDLSARVTGKILCASLQNTKENKCTHRVHYWNGRRQRIRYACYSELLPILHIASSHTAKPYRLTTQEHYPIRGSQGLLHRHESYRLQGIHSHNLPRNLRNRQRQYHNKRQPEPSPTGVHYNTSNEERACNSSGAFQLDQHWTKEYSSSVRHRTRTFNLPRPVRTSDRNLLMPRDGRTWKLLPSSSLSTGLLPRTGGRRTWRSMIARRNE